MIGNCDCCDRKDVPLTRTEAFGIETHACLICCGYDEIDPYGELSGSDGADIEARLKAQFRTD